MVLDLCLSLSLSLCVCVSLSLSLSLIVFLYLWISEASYGPVLACGVQRASERASVLLVCLSPYPPTLASERVCVM